MISPCLLVLVQVSLCLYARVCMCVREVVVMKCIYVSVHIYACVYLYTRLSKLYLPNNVSTSPSHLFDLISLTQVIDPSGKGWGNEWMQNWPRLIQRSFLSHIKQIIFAQIQQDTFCPFHLIHHPFLTLVWASCKGAEKDGPRQCCARFIRNHQRWRHSSNMAIVLCSQ